MNRKPSIAGVDTVPCAITIVPESPSLGSRTDEVSGTAGVGPPTGPLRTVPPSSGEYWKTIGSGAPARGVTAFDGADSALRPAVSTTRTVKVAGSPLATPSTVTVCSHVVDAVFTTLPPASRIS